jgi:anti-sigma factor ChrR (cupin superfamily)
MRAELYADIGDLVPTTTGFAEEIRGSSMVNKTSALENCETSAIGRALANYQFQGSKKRASLEEMVKVYRQGEQPQTTTNAPAAPRSASLGSSSEPPTPKQLALLRSKNWEGDAPSTKREASEIIDRLMNGG